MSAYFLPAWLFWCSSCTLGAESRGFAMHQLVVRCQQICWRHLLTGLILKYFGKLLGRSWYSFFDRLGVPRYREGETGPSGFGDTHPSASIQMKKCFCLVYFGSSLNLVFCRPFVLSRDQIPTSANRTFPGTFAAVERTRLKTRGSGSMFSEGWGSWASGFVKPFYIASSHAFLCYCRVSRPQISLFGGSRRIWLLGGAWGRHRQTGAAPSGPSPVP